MSENCHPGPILTGSKSPKATIPPGGKSHHKVTHGQWSSKVKGELRTVFSRQTKSGPQRGQTLLPTASWRGLDSGKYSRQRTAELRSRTRAGSTGMRSEAG